MNFLMAVEASQVALIQFLLDSAEVRVSDLTDSELFLSRLPVVEGKSRQTFVVATVVAFAPQVFRAPVLEDLVFAALVDAQAVLAVGAAKSLLPDSDGKVGSVA